MATDAFRFRLPRRWSVRRLDPDFGAVSDVEVCDPLGRPTGLRCRVQLTGTDETKTPRALKLSLPKQRLEHYATLVPPMLMVRYRARTGRFYARWAARHDPPRVPHERCARTESIFTWSASDRWDEHSPGLIERDLRLMRQLSTPGFSWPMQFSLEIAENALPGCARADVASAIRKRLAGISRYVAVVEDGVDAQGTVTLSPASLRAAIGGFYDVTIPPCESGGDALPAMLAHLPLLIALVLTRAGQAETAARLCELCESRGVFSRHSH